MSSVAQWIISLITSRCVLRTHAVIFPLYWTMIACFKRKSSSFLGDLRRLRCWRLLFFLYTETGWLKQITDRQCLPKICVQHFHGWDKFQIGIFWLFLNLYAFRIRHKLWICQVWIFRFLREKNYKVLGCKFWTSLHKRVISQKEEIFDEGCVLIKCSFLEYWTSAICFPFSKLCTWFLGTSKVCVQIWDFKKVFKIDIWQRFWQSLCAIRWQVFDVQIIWVHSKW